jgi:hypothetical protein
MMRKSKFSDNQGKCCDAVLRILEDRVGSSRTLPLHFPEKVQHKAPVELTCKIGSTLYALEHTKVEAYPEQMQDGSNFMDALVHLENSITDALPKHAWFNLVVPANSFKGLTARAVKDIGVRIEEWVVRTAPLLKPSDRQMESITESIDGVGFRVTLQAIFGISDRNGKLRISRFPPSDLEVLRSAHIKQMLARKLPKLGTWAIDGAHTVLILESEDIALTNHRLVLEALKLSLQSQTFCPDYIFFVYAVSSTWIVQTLVSEKQFPEIPYQWHTYREFESAKLVDLLA